MELKILILEHDPNDIELIQYELKKSSMVHMSKFVQTEREFRDALLNMQPDVVLSDFNLPSFNGINAFNVKQSLLPEVPFIIVSGTIGEQRAVDLIKMGITDYVLKENLYQIPIKISRALHEVEERKNKKTVERQLADQNEQIKNILESITDGFFSVTPTFIVNYWNQQAEYLLGKKESEIIGKNLLEEFDHPLSAKFYAEFQNILDTGQASEFEEFFNPMATWLQINAYPSKNGVSFFIRNINEIKRSEKVNKLEREVLALYTTKSLRIEATLEYLLKSIQKMHPELICNVLKVEGGLLYPWVHSSLYSSASQLHGIPIAEKGIASSTAAFTKTDYFIKDVAATPAYEDFIDSRKLGSLKSCISFPLLDTSQQIMGTFTIFLKSIRYLRPEEEKTLEKAGLILQNILENYFTGLSIQKSEEKYKRLFQLNPQPMWVYGQHNLQILDVNEAAIDHYGYSLEEFRRMSIKDVLTPQAKASFEEMIPRISSAETIRGTFEHIKKDGEVIFVESKSNVFQFAEKKARLVLINDITEKIKAKRGLELSEMRFRALVQKGSDLINIIDPSGQLIYANPSFGSLIGQEAETVIGKNALAYVHDEDKPLLEKALNSANRHKDVSYATFRLRDCNGNYRWLDATITNLCNEPAVQGIVINSNDITEKTQYINAIELQNTKLKEIAWIQSHIVRAPLARILGLSNLILENPDDDKNELLRYLNISALELDTVIMEIVKRTEEVERFET